MAQWLARSTRYQLMLVIHDLELHQMHPLFPSAIILLSLFSSGLYQELIQALFT